MDLEADERLDEPPTPPEAPNAASIAGILGNIGGPSFHSPAKVLYAEPRILTSPSPAYTAVPISATADAASRSVLEKLEHVDHENYAPSIAELMNCTNTQLVYKSRDLENRAFKLHQEEEQVLSQLRTLGLLPSPSRHTAV